MRIYELEISLETPAIITTDSSSSVLKNTADVIPGMTIRGAVLSRLMQNGFNVLQEVKKPTMAFHPAYPVSNGIKTRPAHPFVYSCKICNSIEDKLDELVKHKFSSEELIRKLKKCSNKGHIFSMRSLGGKLIYYENGVPKTFSVEKVGLTSVGISRLMRSSEKSVIYRYVYMRQGSRFVCLLVDTGGTVNEFLQKSFRITIGRGGSRGFGSATVSVRDVTESHLESRKGFLNGMSSKWAIMISVSPACSISSSGIKPLPQLPNLNIRSYWLTGFQSVSGFSLETGLPKAMLNCARRGSLFLVEMSNQDPQKIAELELVGDPFYSSVGLNLLEVVRFG